MKKTYFLSLIQINIGLKILTTVRMPIAFRRRFGRRKTARTSAGRKTAVRRTLGRKKIASVKRRSFGMKKRRSFGMKKRFTRRGRSHYNVEKTAIYSGAGADVVARGWSRSLIKPSLSDGATVTRTYSSESDITISNVNGADYHGRAWSLQFIYEAATDTCHDEVYLGSPQLGVGTATGIRFQNLASEFQAFTNVFRYFKIKKFQMEVSKLPLPVYMPSQPVVPPGVPSEQQQGGSWTNMSDPGRMLLRPWTGAPAVADFDDGTLTANEWDDHYRYKVKKVEGMAGNVNHPIKFAVTPVQPISIPDTSHVAITTGQLRYTETPAVDIYDFQTGVADANSYGIINYWYFPACAGAITGLLNTQCRFQLEIEYFGLRHPEVSTPIPEAPDGYVFADSKDALVSSLTGDEVKVIHRPDPPPKRRLSVADIDASTRARRVKLVDGKVVYADADAKEYEMPELKRENQQSSVPNSKPIVKDRQLPQSRPPTPTKSR